MERRKRVFISTPAYEGKVWVQYALSLLDTCKVLEMNGYECMVKMPVGSSLLVADRNRILQMFWELEADYLLCVDSDLGWDPFAVLRLLQADKEISGGVYPSRDNTGFTFRPDTEEDGRIVICPDTKLLKMQYMPAGFMLIKRIVIEKMKEKFAHTWYSPKDPRNEKESAHCLFDTEVYDGEFWGEDYVFCRRVRETGFDIWVDPTFQFDHAGIRGCLMQVLTDKSQEGQR